MIQVGGNFSENIKTAQAVARRIREQREPLVEPETQNSNRESLKRAISAALNKNRIRETDETYLVPTEKQSVETEENNPTAQNNLKPEQAEEQLASPFERVVAPEESEIPQTIAALSTDESETAQPNEETDESKQAHLEVEEKQVELTAFQKMIVKRIMFLLATKDLKLDTLFSLLPGLKKGFNYTPNGSIDYDSPETKYDEDSKDDWTAALSFINGLIPQVPKERDTSKMVFARVFYDPEDPQVHKTPMHTEDFEHLVWQINDVKRNLISADLYQQWTSHKMNPKKSWE